MGTSHCNSITKERLFAELTAPFTNTDHKGVVKEVRSIASAWVGNQFFLVREVKVTPTDDDPYSGPYKYRFIDVTIIEGYGKSWSWKEMTETMHPYHYDCPALLIAIAGPPRYECGASWRRNCIHAQLESEFKFDQISYIRSQKHLAHCLNVETKP